MKKTLFLLVGLIAFFLYACLDELKLPSSSEPRPNDSFGISEAKRYFEENAEDLSFIHFRDSMPATRTTGRQQTELTPDWDKAVLTSNQQVSLVEIPILSNALMFSNVYQFEKGKNIRSRACINTVRLVIARHKDGKTDMFVITLIPSLKYSKQQKNMEHFRYLGGSDFTGKVFASRLDGRFVEASQYVKGRFAGLLEVTTRKQLEKNKIDISKDISYETITFIPAIQTRAGTYNFEEDQDKKTNCEFHPLYPDSNCPFCLEEALVRNCQACGASLEEGEVCNCKCPTCGKYPCECSCSSCHMYRCICCPICGKYPCLCRNCPYCNTYPCICASTCEQCRPNPCIACRQCRRHYCFGSCIDTGGSHVDKNNPGKFSKCGLILKSCKCKRCPKCNQFLENCKCPRCPNCHILLEKCKCPKCPVCHKFLVNCECPPCPKCNQRPINCRCLKEIDCSPEAIANSSASSYNWSKFLDVGLKTEFLEKYRDASVEYATTLEDTNGIYSIQEVYTDSVYNSVGLKYGKYTAAAVHNHPQGNPPSLKDALTLAEMNSTSNGKYESSFVVPKTGPIYVLHVTDKKKASLFHDLWETKSGELEKEMIEIQKWMISNGDRTLSEKEYYGYTLAEILQKYNSGISLLQLEEGSGTFKQMEATVEKKDGQITNIVYTICK